MSAPATILRAYRTELDATVEQRRALSRYAGAARWTYNWTLARWRQEQEARKKRLRRLRHLVVWMASRAPRPSVLATARAWYKELAPKVRGPSWMSIHKELTQEKRRPETAWLREISAYVPREACHDVGDAYSHFFRRLREGKRGRAAGEPQFRSRHDPSGRGFRIAQPQAIDVSATHVKIAGIGMIRLKEHGYIPPGGNFRGLSCREVAGRWYVAVQVEEPAADSRPLERKEVGVEIGVRVLALTSEGKRFGAIRDLASLAVAQRRLALWQRRMARRYVRGKATRDQSAGWRAAVAETQKYNALIARIRKDTLHQTTCRIVRSSRADTLVVRDMQVQRMIGKAGKQSRQEKRARNAIAPMVQQVGMYELRRQLEYKQGWSGGVVEVAPNDYPSTRRCSVCGAVRDTEPGYPDFRCQSPTCGSGLDRETNSAHNLRDFVRGNSGEPGGGTRRRKTPKGAQRPAEPGSQAGGSNPAGSGPDGDETSALGTGNRASAEQSVDGTGGE
jgi:putative transposase